MIGDHINNDYTASTDYGFHGIHMDRNKTDKARSNQRIYVLKDLLTIFA